MEQTTLDEESLALLDEPRPVSRQLLACWMRGGITAVASPAIPARTVRYTARTTSQRGSRRRPIVRARWRSKNRMSALNPIAKSVS